MPLNKTLFGTTRAIPITDERGWGAVVTSVLADLIDAVDSFGFLTGTDVGLLRFESTTTALAAGATLTPTHPVHKVAGSGGAVVLDATTAVADGSVAGRLLPLFGTDDVNTVEVPAAANTQLNGPCILTNGDALEMFWDATLSAWRERNRSN